MVVTRFVVDATARRLHPQVGRLRGHRSGRRPRCAERGAHPRRAAGLTDVNMPNMDGISLTRELRTLASYKFRPILLLTTESAPEKKLQGKAAGATGWLVKPFNPEQLLATVKKVLG